MCLCTYRCRRTRRSGRAARRLGRRKSSLPESCRRRRIVVFTQWPAVMRWIVWIVFRAWNSLGRPQEFARLSSYSNRSAAVATAAAVAGRPQSSPPSSSSSSMLCYGRRLLRARIYSSDTHTHGHRFHGANLLFIIIHIRSQPVYSFLVHL